METEIHPISSSGPQLGRRTMTPFKTCCSSVSIRQIPRLAVLLLWLTFQHQPCFASGSTSLLLGSTIGGSQIDRVNAVATDSAGNIFLAGDTYSGDFPGGGAVRPARRSLDAFVVKLDPTGTRILYVVFLGGSGGDSASGIALDAQGSAYVTGVTTSADFPTTAGAFQRTSGSPGIAKAFVAKLNSTGSVVWSTYLGGSSSDTAYGIAVDASGAAYVAGSTNSSNFPTTTGVPQTTFGGGADCFIAKLDPSASRLVFSTLLGGEAVDICTAIAVDASGSAFVTGATDSAHFPLAAPLKPTLTGTFNAFLTKLSPAGDRFVFSTYLGGNGFDEGNAVQVGPSGTIYVAGDTTSTSLPVTAGAPQKTLGGNYDGFVFMVANDGSGILYATYLGGTASDSITGLAVAPNGTIGLTGFTASTNFPVVNPVQPSFGGFFDAFLAVLSPDGTSLMLSTYIGGGGDDRSAGIAALGSGAFLIGGQMLAGSVPYLNNGVFSSPAGQYDGFFAAIPLTESAGLRFVPLAPCRVADTRNATGPFGGPAVAGLTQRDFALPSSACGVPATAQAYSLNITVVPLGWLGYLTVWPSGQTQPVVSLLNSLDGRIKANAAIVPAGNGGAVSIYVSNTSHVIIDINGYFVSATNASALAFYPTPQCRIADTRASTGPLGGPSLTAGKSRTFPILSSACAISVNAQAYSLNFTVLPKVNLGYLSAWPTGTAQPTVSTLNALTGAVTANAAFVPAGTNGSIDAYGNNDTDLLIDINGYFAAAGPGGLSLNDLALCRVLDTRLPAGSPPISGTNDFQVFASGCNIPSTAQVFVLNATAIPIGPLYSLTLWPLGQGQPVASTLNAPDGAITSDMAIIPGSTGWISAFLSNPAHLVLDISGYFAP